MFCARTRALAGTQLFGAGYVEGMSWSQATLGYLAYTPDVQGIYYAPNATFVNGYAFRNAHVRFARRAKSATPEHSSRLFSLLSSPLSF